MNQISTEMKQQQVEWRRAKVLELSSQGYSDSEYLIGLEPKLVRLLSPLQDYKVAIQDYKDIQKYGEELERHKKVLEQSKELEENNKRLRHVLESCHRLRTEKEDPPIDLGNGKFLVSIQNPTVWKRCA